MDPFFKIAPNVHLTGREVDFQNCLSYQEGETCFPLKTTPGLAIDYQNRRARVEGLSRWEGERMLRYFAEHAPQLNIEKEEAWALLEMQKKGAKRVMWIEIGYEESPDGVSGDGIALSEAQFQLETEGWTMTTLYVHHIHPRLGNVTKPDIYEFSYSDLVATSALLLPLLSQRFLYFSEGRVVTPVGVYVLRLNEQDWESRDQYYDRFQKGLEWFVENEKQLAARCFTPGRDLVEASGCFAIGANTLLAAHAWPIAISFIPLPDR